MIRRTAHLLRETVHWPVSSQQTSRRNALVACTALAERRREHDEVEEFLERHRAVRTDRVTLEVRVRPA